MNPLDDPSLVLLALLAGPLAAAMPPPGVWERHAGAVSAVIYDWPVEDPSADQAYAVPNAHPGMSRRYDAGIDVHTGVDIRPAGSDLYDFSRPVFAAADGWIERLIPYGNETKGMGNTVILRHADGLYSLYGHLDFYPHRLERGDFVPRGRFLGNMGNSGVTARTVTLTHVHFEIKTSPGIGDGPGPPHYAGYVPGHPDLFGYVDPRALIDALPITDIPPETVRVVDPNGATLRGSPGPDYLGAVATPILDRLDTGTIWVATRSAFAEGADWMFVETPSTRRPIHGAMHPIHGPAGGWVDASTLAPEPAAAVATVRARTAVVRTCPAASCAGIARLVHGRPFAIREPAVAGPGCARGWTEVSTPASAGTSRGWACVATGAADR